MEPTSRFIVTPTLVAMNVAIFLALVAVGVSPTNPGPWDLLPFGANFGGYTVNGQWWRLIACTFLHFGIVHLGFNMWCLWSLGRLAERLFGSWQFLAIYLITGVSGSAASVIAHPHVFSAGASGSVFGIAGALAAFLHFGRIHLPENGRRDLLTSIVFFISINLLIGFSLEFVDNAGHLGGLVMGGALGAVLGALRTNPRAFPAAVVGALGLLLASLPFAKERTLASAEVLQQEATLLAVSARSDEAIDKIEDALEEETTADRLALASELYLNAGRRDEAIDYARRAVELDPHHQPAQQLLGTSLFNAGRYEEASVELRLAIELEPVEQLRAAIDRNPAALQNYILLARSFRELDRQDEAVEVLVEALEWAPDSFSVNNEIGLAYYRIGEIGLAAERVRKAAEIEPDHPESYNRLSLILARAGDRDEALQAVEKALELLPNAPHLLDSLGTVRFYRGELTQAVEAYREAVALEPRRAVYQYNLSTALLENGDLAAAKEAREEALRLQPSFEPSEEGEPEI